MLTQLTDQKAMEMADKVGKVFEGVPHLPKGLVDFLVKITPWLVVLGGVLSVLGGLSSILGNGLNQALFTNYLGLNRTYFIITGIFSLVLGGLYLMAFKPLKDLKKEGWMYLFWAQVVGVVQSVVMMVYVGGGFLGTVIGLMIGFYLLYEVKKSYTK
jgi:hypothetical protein